MIHIEASITIAQPIERVFAYAADYEHDPTWRTEVQQLRYDARPIQLGSHATEVASVLGRRPETVTEVVEYAPPHEVVSRSLTGPVPIVATRTFVPVPDGTRMTYRLDGDERGVVLFRLMRPWLARWYQRKVEGFLRTLKQLVEAEGAARESGGAEAASSGDGG